MRVMPHQLCFHIDTGHEIAVYHDFGNFFFVQPVTQNKGFKRPAAQSKTAFDLFAVAFADADQLIEEIQRIFHVLHPLRYHRECVGWNILRQQNAVTIENQAAVGCERA